MTTLLVQKEKLIFNLSMMQRVTSSLVIPVLKGNAYGLGELETAAILYNTGVRLIAVSHIEEADHIKSAIPELDILLLTPYSTEKEAERIVDLGIIATVGSYDSAVLLNGIAEKKKKKCRIHIKFDTGMGRFGFLPDEADKAVQTAKYLNDLEVCGCFTHLSSANGEHKKLIFKQLELFKDCIKTLENNGINPGLKHIANSAAAILYPQLRLDAVRVGTALLGRVNVKNKLGLKKVGRLESEICETRWLPAGHNIGYSNAVKAKKPTRIAVIPAGYADGIFVERSKDKFRVRDVLGYCLHDLRLLFGGKKLTCEINGKPMRILGRIDMSNIIVDVSSVDCAAGDIVSFDVNPVMVNAKITREYI